MLRIILFIILSVFSALSYGLTGYAANAGRIVDPVGICQKNLLLWFKDIEDQHYERAASLMAPSFIAVNNEDGGVRTKAQELEYMRIKSSQITNRIISSQYLFSGNVIILPFNNSSGNPRAGLMVFQQFGNRWLILSLAD